MSLLLAKHVATIECDHCPMGKHTGQSDESFKDAYIDAKAQEARCQHRTASLIRAVTYHSSNPQYRRN